MQKFLSVFKRSVVKGLLAIFFVALTFISFDFVIRQASAFTAVDCSHVEDAKDDVSIKTATTTTEPFSPMRADMLSADLIFLGDTWFFSVTTSEPVTAVKDENYSILLLLDTNGSIEDNFLNNNDRRIGGDTYYIAYFTNTSTRLWNVQKYRHNVATWKWQQYQTSSTLDIQDRALTIKIPEAELPASAGKNWRVLSAVGTTTWVSRDDLPDKRDDANSCGYLPALPVPETGSLPMSIASTSTASGFWDSSWGDMLSVAMTALLLVSIFGLSVLSSRRETE